MSNITVILFIVLVLYVIGDVIYRLYHYKTNDGKITNDEIKSLIKVLEKDIANILNNFTNGDEKKYIRDCLINIINKKLTSLSEEDKQLLTNNMDRILDYIIENKTEIIDDFIEKGSENSNKESENK